MQKNQRLTGVRSTLGPGAGSIAHVEDPPVSLDEKNSAYGALMDVYRCMNTSSTSSRQSDSIPSDVDYRLTKYHGSGHVNTMGTSKQRNGLVENILAPSGHAFQTPGLSASNHPREGVTAGSVAGTVVSTPCIAKKTVSAVQENEESASAQTSRSVTSASESSLALRDTDGFDAEVPNFVWGRSMHRRLLMALFDYAMKYASPKKLRKVMGNAFPESLTTEHMKSHLQKLRNNAKATRDAEVQLCETALRQEYDTRGTYTGPAIDDPRAAYGDYPFPMEWLEDIPQHLGEGERETHDGAKKNVVKGQGARQDPMQTPIEINRGYKLEAGDKRNVSHSGANMPFGGRSPKKARLLENPASAFSNPVRKSHADMAVLGAPGEAQNINASAKGGNVSEEQQHPDDTDYSSMAKVGASSMAREALTVTAAGGSVRKGSINLPSPPSVIGSRQPDQRLILEQSMAARIRQHHEMMQCHAQQILQYAYGADVRKLVPDTEVKSGTPSLLNVAAAAAAAATIEAAQDVVKDTASSKLGWSVSSHKLDRVSPRERDPEERHVETSVVHDALDALQKLSS